MAINVAIILAGLNDGLACFNVMNEPTILLSLVLNFVLGKCERRERWRFKVHMSTSHTQLACCLHARTLMAAALEHNRAA